MMALWVREYREANGMELDDFARAVNRYGRRMTPRLTGTVTDQLIHLLEIGGVTHPRFANAIAEYCGATAQQRDMLVNKIHHGEWEPNRYVNPCEVKLKEARSGARPVVKVNLQANVIAAYASVVEAARHDHMNEDNVRKRCKRRMKQEITLDMPYTYRYQEEWFAMSREEQLRDVLPYGEIVG